MWISWLRNFSFFVIKIEIADEYYILIYQNQYSQILYIQSIKFKKKTRFKFTLFLA